MPFKAYFRKQKRFTGSTRLNVCSSRRKGTLHPQMHAAFRRRPGEGAPSHYGLVLSAPEDLGWYPNGHRQRARGPEARMGHTAGPLLAHTQPGRYLPLE